MNYLKLLGFIFTGSVFAAAYFTPMEGIHFKPQGSIPTKSAYYSFAIKSSDLRPYLKTPQATESPLLRGGQAEIVNADVNASAAIAYSKLNLANSLLNADVNSSAAIAYSKLNLSNSILNADVAASAAIALSKLASQGNYTFVGQNTSTPGVPVSFTATQSANMMRVVVTASAEIAVAEIDWSAADYFEKTLTGNTTLTFANQRKGQCIFIDLANTASNYTVAWPANVRWPSDSTPTATVGARSDATSCCYNGTITKCVSTQNFRVN